MTYIGSITVQTKVNKNLIDDAKANEHKQHPTFGFDIQRVKLILDQARVKCSNPCSFMVNEDEVAIVDSRVLYNVSSLIAMTDGVDVVVEYEYGNSLLVEPGSCDTGKGVLELALKVDLLDKKQSETTSQLDNKVNFLEDVSADFEVPNDEFVDSVNALKARVDEHITNHPAGEDISTLVTTPIVNNTLTLTTDKYQKTTMVNNTTIALPTVTSFAEIHLFFSTIEDLTLIFPSVKWQSTPNIKANKTYEVIFTYVDSWLGGIVSYE